MSKSIVTSQFLKFALIGDAVASGFTGLLMATASGPLSNFLDLPTQLMFWAGTFLVPYAFVLGFLGTRENISLSAVWAIIILNAVWAFDSIALLLSGWVQPTTLGLIFVLGQALIVLVFAELQFLGVRKTNSSSQQSIV